MSDADEKKPLLSPRSTSANAVSDTLCTTQLQVNRKKIPLGGWILAYMPIINRYPRISFQGLVLIITFLCYTCYHMNRRPLSAVKSTLSPNCSKNYSQNYDGDKCIAIRNTSLNGSAWEPFGDESECEELFGILDYSWGFPYAIAMFITGIIAERVDLRYFLTIGMIGSAMGSALFGISYYANIHSIYYLVFVRVFSGIMQSTGWPAVVPIMGNWFGIKRRGLFMGIWNSHTSVGNIAGLALAGIFAKPDKWAWSFFVPAFIMFGMAIVTFFFLVVDPSHLGLSPPLHHLDTPSTAPASPVDEKNFIENDEPLVSSTEGKKVEEGTVVTHRKSSVTSLLQKVNPVHVITGNKDHGAIGIIGALRIPGVIEYSLALFFSKLVAYTFLFWLPFYIATTCIGGEKLTSTQSDLLSNCYDVGGIIGSIFTGLLSDIIKARAITCTIMLYLSVPILFLYNSFGQVDISVTIVLILFCGLCINGPYACITTAVSSDLGTHRSLRGNLKAKATVTAIIDGTGSIGAAIGPLLAGWLSGMSWDYVFYSLMVSSFLSSLFLTRLVFTEFRQYYVKYITRNYVAEK